MCDYIQTRAALEGRTGSRKFPSTAPRRVAAPSPTGEPHMLLSDVVRSEWLRRIRAEYQEVPGMNLTKAQVQRLWGLDDVTCDTLLDDLVKAGFLRRTRTQGYVRADNRF